MENKLDHKHSRLILLLLSAVLFVLSFLSAQAAEEEGSFSELIEQFVQEGIIPDVGGRFLTFSDFEDSFRNMGYFQATPLFEAEHFVLSSKIAWTSANQAPNAMTSGCGILFNAASGSSDHLLLSFRMDGNIYLTGYKNYRSLSYGKYAYAIPSSSGETQVTLVVDGERAVVYVKDQPVMQRSDLTEIGDRVGFAVLAGTFQDFGTRCSFSDINVYVWDAEPQK